MKLLEGHECPAATDTAMQQDISGGAVLRRPQSLAARWTFAGVVGVGIRTKGMILLDDFTKFVLVDQAAELPLPKPNSAAAGANFARHVLGFMRHQI